MVTMVAFSPKFLFKLLKVIVERNCKRVQSFRSICISFGNDVF